MNIISRDPASAGSRRVRPAILLLGVVLIAACRSPFDDTSEFSAEPLPELAERADAEPVPIEDVPPTIAATSSTAVAGDSSDPTPTATTTAPASTTVPTAEPEDTPPVPPVRIQDPRGDADPGPAYADGLLLATDDLGADVRVTVQVAGQLPEILSESEVMGIGVDVFTSGGEESDYQIFADGGSDGWRAFLQTPEGFVDFPGTFRVGGDLVQFEVPWTSIGGKREPVVDGFVDWGEPNALGLVERSSDFLPDRDDGGLLGG